MGEWNRRGRWVETNASAARRDRSYHHEDVITREWHLLVTEFLGAQNAKRAGAIEPLKIFVQKRRALPWTDDFMSQDRVTVREALGWDAEETRIMTIDRRADGLHYGLIRSWSRDGESRRVWWGKLWSEVEIVEKQREHNVDSRKVLIDCGYEPREVYRMCVKQGWRALRGDPKASFPHHVKHGAHKVSVQRSFSVVTYGDPEMGTRRQGAGMAPIIAWSNPTIKDRLDRLVRLGKWTEPPDDPNDPMDVEYRRQWKGQRKIRRVNKQPGQTRWEWVDNGNDHARDCANMQVVVATILQFLPDMDTEEAVDKPDKG
jgi:hypothetical protein